MRYSEFYAGSEHPRRSALHRSIGGLDLRMTRIRQGAHALSDPPTEELIVGVVLGGDTHCRWTWGEGWNVSAHRRAGDVGITPPRTAGQFEVDGDHEILVIGFSLEALAKRGFIENPARDLDFARLHDAYHRQGNSFAWCKMLWRLAGDGSPEANAQAEITTVKLLALWRVLAGRAPPASATIRPLDDSILCQMAEDIDDAPALRRPISYWAQRAGLSPEQFCRAFKARTGESALRWSHRRRLRLIEPLLHMPGADIDRIAADFGFDSRAHFNRVFAKMTGRTPRMAC